MQKLKINDFIIIDTFGGLEYKIRLNKINIAENT